MVVTKPWMYKGNETMKKYSKLIGAVIGIIISFAGVYGLNFEFLADPIVQQAVVGLGSLIGLWAAPANEV